MIPYFTLEAFTVGPLTIHAWGFFVALGILLGTLLAAARALMRGVDPAHVFSAATWAVVSGFIGARALYLAEAPSNLSFLQSFRVQDGGMSAFGGLTGGIIAAVLYARRHKIRLPLFADIVAPALLLGEGIGRIGCFLIHDHLGRPTNLPIAINVFGVPRHEVGLYLSLAGFAGFLAIALLEKMKTWSSGSLAFAALAWYSTARFLLDFLRAADLPVVDHRYAGLTLAQYVALVGAAVALAGLAGRGSVFRGLRMLRAPGKGS